jgi:hypothetical protein
MDERALNPRFFEGAAQKILAKNKCDSGGMKLTIY